MNPNTLKRISWYLSKYFQIRSAPEVDLFLTVRFDVLNLANQSEVTMCIFLVTASPSASSNNSGSRRAGKCLRIARASDLIITSTCCKRSPFPPTTGIKSLPRTCTSWLENPSDVLHFTRVLRSAVIPISVMKNKFRQETTSKRSTHLIHPRHRQHPPFFLNLQSHRIHRHHCRASREKTNLSIFKP